MQTKMLRHAINDRLPPYQREEAGRLLGLSDDPYIDEEKDPFFPGIYTFLLFGRSSARAILCQLFIYLYLII